MNEIANESQEMRRQFFTLISAQVVFIVDGGIQMLTKQTFGSSPTATYPAKFLLQLQNTLAHQVKQEIEASGSKFDKLLDVTISAIVPLGHMTHEEFWEGMNSEQPEVEPMATAMPPPTPTAVTSISRKPKKKTS